MDGFYSTWAQARQTFGVGTPQDGSEFGDGSRLRQMQSSIESAKPDSRWQGSAADAYTAKNQQHAAVYGKLADLDQRMAAEVSRAATVVTAGRQNLERTQNWVSSMEASIPPGKSAETMRIILASKGIGQISDLIQQSNTEMSAIGERVRGIGREYEAISEEGKDKTDPGTTQLSDDEKKPNSLPTTTFDLSDIKQLPPYDPDNPKTFGPPGYRELVPNSGTWVPDPTSPFYRPTPVQAPLDYNDIVYKPPYVPGNPDTYGPPGYTELVPGSGTWVPTPGGPMWPKDPPEAPVDLTKIDYRPPYVSGDPSTYGKFGYTELVPNGAPGYPTHAWALPGRRT
ncbi:EspA/EspE family type VII secretion system effector [Mycolicibacterium fortuitum]|uniref:EspA/EspE family type VII secretion system effector n=1 Tax=Mycolicibacterium fortuitum TaxID=1766 RepID=UPI0020C229C8|nr:EspA/EspE family type VII secretion system effector [Mycolicibacterium fortuitum]